MAQTRPIGCTALDESAASPPLGAVGLDLHCSSSRSRCAGSARRRRMRSRLLFRRCTSFALAGSWSRIAALTDSCVRSSGTFTSPVRHFRLSPPTRFCRVACVTHRSRYSLNGSQSDSLAVHTTTTVLRDPCIAIRKALAKRVVRIREVWLCFSSSTATAVLSRYVPCMLPSHPCLPRWGDDNPGRAAPWAAPTRRSSLC
jgi:hypothetical protein